MKQRKSKLIYIVDFFGFMLDKDSLMAQKNSENKAI
jgi:hypothetical protein